MTTQPITLSTDVLSYISLFDGSNKIKNLSKMIRNLSNKMEKSSNAYNNYLVHYNKYLLRNNADNNTSDYLREVYTKRPEYLYEEWEGHYSIVSKSAKNYKYVNINYEENINWKDHCTRIYLYMKIYSERVEKCFVNYGCGKLKVIDTALFPQELDVRDLYELKYSKRYLSNHPDYHLQDLGFYEDVSGVEKCAISALFVDGFEIKCICRHFFDNIKLATVEITNADKVRIFDSDKYDGKLKIKYKNDNEIVRLPYFSNLTKLTLISDKTVTISFSDVCKMRGLKKISLAKVNLIDFNVTNETLPVLEKLKFSHPNIKTIPKEIFMLDQISNLSFRGCENICKIPKEIKNLQKLTKISLYRTRIYYLPKKIKKINSCRNEKNKIKIVLAESKTKSRALNKINNFLNQYFNTKIF